MELRQMGINFGINTLRATIGITGFGFRTARIIGNQLLYPVTSLVDRATIMATRDDTPNLLAGARAHDIKCGLEGARQNTDRPETASVVIGMTAIALIRGHNEGSIDDGKSTRVARTVLDRIESLPNSAHVLVGPEQVSAIQEMADVVVPAIAPKLEY